LRPDRPVLVPVCLLLAVAAGSTAGGGTLPVSSEPRQASSPTAPVTDYASLIDRLRAAGVRVEPRGEVDQPFLSVKGRMIGVRGEDVQVFQYAGAAAARAQAALVSRDGRTVGTTKLHWIGPPHFYQRGRLLVLYVGSDERVLKALDAVLGRPFAGQ
jgi:hypothetical protein